MSPYPSPSPSSSVSSAISPNGRLHTVIIVLSILAAFLIVYIIFITLKAKKEQPNSERAGPYTGTTISPNHPAAEIAPFGNYSHSGATGPRYKHTPGEDMRIAVRRPDGGWNFSDSRTPFNPSGVKDLDNVPSLKSSASIISSSSNGRILSKKADEVKMERLRRCPDPYLEFDLSPTVPPPPAYHPEASRDQSVTPHT